MTYPFPMGATVTLRVAKPFVGIGLHKLEGMADVFILDRASGDFDDEEWTLRSDIFPSCWDGAEVTATANEKKPGLEFTIRSFCTFDMAASDRVIQTMGLIVPLRLNGMK